MSVSYVRAAAGAPKPMPAVSGAPAPLACSLFIAACTWVRLTSAEAARGRTTDAARPKQVHSLVRDLFADAGFEVELRLGRAPDDDLVFLSSSKYMVPGGGSFSTVAARVATGLRSTVLFSAQHVACGPIDASVPGAMLA